MMLYISIKFINGFQDIERTRFCDRLMDRQELWFLSSARHLMMLYICMTFHENVLNGFLVTGRTQVDTK